MIGNAIKISGRCIKVIEMTCHPHRMTLTSYLATYTEKANDFCGEERERTKVMAVTGDEVNNKPKSKRKCCNF